MHYKLSINSSFLTHENKAMVSWKCLVNVYKICICFHLKYHEVKSLRKYEKTQKFFFFFCFWTKFQPWPKPTSKCSFLTTNARKTPN